MLQVSGFQLCRVFGWDLDSKEVVDVRVSESVSNDALILNNIGGGS